jgi:hypothetical protein
MFRKKMKSLALMILWTVTTLFTAQSYANTLSSQDSSQLAMILANAGVKPHQANNGSVVILDAGAITCVGRNFQNMCMLPVLHQNNDILRFTGDAAAATWSLLKKAGVKNTISDVSDGSFGDSVISSDHVICQTPSNSHMMSCSVEVKI